MVTKGAERKNIQMIFRPCSIEVDDLLLDPNNYRFLDDPDYKKRLTTRYHDVAVQTATLRLLEKSQSYQLRELRQSILSNGYIPIERIIISRYHHKKGKYLVIEGNRRVAALKSILRDAKEGVLSLRDDQIKSFHKIPAAVLETSTDSMVEAERVLMGIRHIVGPREWGAYQRAHLILELIDEEGMEASSVANHLGISTVDVTRRYRAMKALKAMENDDLYSGTSKPEYYRLFHEFVALPAVRERFGWDQEKETFADCEKAREFFELIAPQDPDAEPKLRTYFDVRKLKVIVGNRIAEGSLLNPEESLNDAMKFAEAKSVAEVSSAFLEIVRNFQSTLKGLSVDDLSSLTKPQVHELESLVSLIKQRITNYRALQK
jgi:ParB-like chromosome segregation protein Spo0J